MVLLNCLLNFILADGLVRTMKVKIETHGKIEVDLPTEEQICRLFERKLEYLQKYFGLVPKTVEVDFYDDNPFVPFYSLIISDGGTYRAEYGDAIFHGNYETMGLTEVIKKTRSIYGTFEWWDEIHSTTSRN